MKDIIRFATRVVALVVSVSSLALLGLLFYPGATSRIQGELMSFDENAARLVSGWTGIVYVAPADLDRVSMPATFWPIHDIAFALRYKPGDPFEATKFEEGKQRSFLVERVIDQRPYLAGVATDVCFDGFNGKLDDALLRSGIRRLLLNELSLVVMTINDIPDEQMHIGRCDGEHE